MGKKMIYTGPITPGKNTPKTFRDMIAPTVVRLCTNTGVFPSVIIGIGIKESGNGNDYKAFHYNNFFGLAANGWSGDSVKTPKGKVWWRAYPNMEGSIQATIDTIRKAAFRAQGTLKAKNPKEQLIALQKGPTLYNADQFKHLYVDRVMKNINAFDLNIFDSQMIAMERMKNENGLAFNEQDAVTKALHSIFG